MHTTRTSWPSVPAVMSVSATTAYALTASLGAGVATRVIDTSRARWLHHAMFIATTTLTVAAIVASALPQRRRGTRAGLWLGPTLLPLAILPRVDARTRAHPMIAGSAAPFHVAATISVARCAPTPATRKGGR